MEKGNILINMDAQAPNKVFAEWAGAGNFLPDVTAIRPEYTYGASRLDFCLETPAGLHLVEVKGVQLKDVNSVAPNDATHPAFGQALREAAAHGVRVLAYDCNVTPDSLTIRREVPVIL